MNAKEFLKAENNWGEKDTGLFDRNSLADLLEKYAQQSNRLDGVVMQLLAGKGINAVELRHLLNKVKRVKIKDNLREILTTTFPDEYTDSDYIFFERYAGKEANIYQWAGDWWILEDDNYLITPDCFEELSKQCA